MERNLTNEVAEWVNKNPLKKFRADYSLPVTATAAILGVNALTVRQWEEGGHKPNEKNMETIALLFRITLEQAQGMWERWYSARPKL